jgi:glycosyltransferase involved in cell wall biosynthesis
MGKVAIITVTYNSASNLSFFLPSVAINTDVVAGVFFVDNSSSDGTRNILKDWKEKNDNLDVYILPQKENYGYAYAINLGIQKALSLGYDYLLITNNDIVFDTEAVSLLLDNLTKNNLDVVGIPSSINKENIGLGYFLSTENLLPIKKKPLTRSNLDIEIQRNPLLRVDFVHGGTALFSKKFFEKIGLYDSKLFFGGDELDFLYRVYAYNISHTDKITCAVSLQAFLKVDNLSKHNTKNKIRKAKRMLQGVARVYLKHRFTPTDIGLYREQYSIIKSLAKNNLLRYGVLFLFSMRALIIEITNYYTERL